MGRRKTARKRVSRPRERLPTIFNCLYCSGEGCADIKIDSERKVGTVSCRICKAEWKTVTNSLSKPVDVYADWVDACEMAHQFPTNGDRSHGDEDDEDQVNAADSEDAYSDNDDNNYRFNRQNPAYSRSRSRSPSPPQSHYEKPRGQSSASRDRDRPHLKSVSSRSAGGAVSERSRQGEVARQSDRHNSDYYEDSEEDEHSDRRERGRSTAGHPKYTGASAKNIEYEDVDDDDVDGLLEQALGTDDEDEYQDRLAGSPQSLNLGISRPTEKKTDENAKRHHASRLVKKGRHDAQNSYAADRLSDDDDGLYF